MVQASSCWEEAAECGVCGSRVTRPAWSICSRRFVVCADCGVLRLYDRVVERRLDLLYAGCYPSADPSPDEIEEQLRNPTFHYRRRRIEACPGARERRLLEIGCGDGNFLAVMQRGGWQVDGLEFDAGTAALVERRHRIPVLVGDLVDVSPERPFAVVAAYHVVEHVYHPAEWMRRVRQLIEPQGLLHVQTPNLASATRYAGGRAWAAMVFPEHVYLYTPRTLRALLERFGFTVLSATTWDPWHGPGVTANTLANIARRVVTGRLPWTDRLEDRAKVPAASVAAVERHALKALARSLLDLASRPLSRVEAAIGFGAVVDIVARRSG